MATLHITEYTNLAIDNNQHTIPAGNEPAAANQVVTFTTNAASSAFGVGVRFIRIMSTDDAFIQIAETPVATTATTKIKANTVEFFGIRNDDLDYKIAAYDGSS